MSYIKLTELEQYKQYEIESFQIEDTPLGIEEVLIYFKSGGHAYLPPRFIKLSQYEIDGLNSIEVTIMKTGNRPCTFGLMADFLFFSDSENNEAFKKLNEINILRRPYVKWFQVRKNWVFRVKYQKTINILGEKEIIRFGDGNYIFKEDVVDDLEEMNALFQSMSLAEREEREPHNTYIKMDSNGWHVTDQKPTSDNIYECCYGSLED